MERFVKASRIYHVVSGTERQQVRGPSTRTSCFLERQHVLPHGVPLQFIAVAEHERLQVQERHDVPIQLHPRARADEGGHKGRPERLAGELAAAGGSLETHGVGGAVAVDAEDVLVGVAEDQPERGSVGCERGWMTAAYPANSTTS